jgi:hypothetical protein
MAANTGASAESLCPSCGRTTRTTASGACMECWQAKSSSGRPVFRRRPERTEPLFDFSLDALVVPDWAWWVVAGGVITAIAFAARALIG